MCQLEQIRDHEMRKQMIRDVDSAWHEIQSRHHKMRSEKEEFVDKCRRSEGLSIQDFLKDQMADKIERSLAVHEEINEEQKQLALVYKEDREMEQQRLAEEKNTRKFVKEAISVSSSSLFSSFFL